MNYQITINIDDATLAYLYENKFSLRVFKGAEISTNVIYNTVWFTTSQFTNTVTIAWKNEHAGYFQIPAVELKPGTVINNNEFNPLHFGEQLSIAKDGTLIKTPNAGAGRALTLVNTNSALSFCGSAQSVGGRIMNYNVMNIIPNQTIIMQPCEVLLLVFEATYCEAGTVVLKTQNASIKIMLNNVQSTISLAYNYLSAWAANGDIKAVCYHTPVVISDVLNSQNLF